MWDPTFAGIFTKELSEPAWSRLLPRRPLAGGLAGAAPVELEAIMSTCFAVQDRHKIIVVAVRCLGGYRVFSSELAYRKLENRIFQNAWAVERSVAGLGAAL